MENSMAILRKKTKKGMQEKAWRLQDRADKIVRKRGEKAYKKELKQEEKFFSKEKEHYESIHGKGTYPKRWSSVNKKFIEREADKARTRGMKKARKKNVRVRMLSKVAENIEKRKRKKFSS